MKNKIFLDSNILIYLYTVDEANKVKMVQNIINKHENVIISTQVLFEFSYVLHRKLKCTYSDIEKAFEEFYRAFDIVTLDYGVLCKALKIASEYKYSFPDSLIIATALEYGCDILYSEDMQNNQIIKNSLKICNPFLS